MRRGHEARWPKSCGNWTWTSSSVRPWAALFTPTSWPGQTAKRAIFTERVDNVMTLKRFSIRPGEKCIIAEDVVTTGVSSLETKRVIEEAGGECLGIVCVVDRTKADAPSPIPILASAAKLDLPNYAPEECPICKEGKLPLVHLGSRKMKEQARQTL